MKKCCSVFLLETKRCSEIRMNFPFVASHKSLFFHLHRLDDAIHPSGKITISETTSRYNCSKVFPTLEMLLHCFNRLLLRNESCSGIFLLPLLDFVEGTWQRVAVGHKAMNVISTANNSWTSKRMMWCALLHKSSMVFLFN